jgi:hypothetical protein
VLCARAPAVDCTPLIREVVGSQGGGEKAFKSLKRPGSRADNHSAPGSEGGEEKPFNSVLKRPGAHPTVARVDAHSALCGRRVLSRFRV